MKFMSTINKTAVVLDFDRTLFDTDSFKNDLAKSLSDLGVTSNIFFKLYPKAVTKNGDGVNSYNLNKHVKLMVRVVKFLSTKQTREKLLSVFKKSYCYLYPETIKFLIKLKQNNFYLILLSHGPLVLQRLKINHSNIVSYFSEIVVLDGKVKAPFFKKMTKKFNRVWFVSDHLGELQRVKSNFAKVKLIMKLSPSSKVDFTKEKRILKARKLFTVFKIIKSSEKLK